MLSGLCSAVFSVIILNRDNTMEDYWNRPCAAHGLKSYRYRGRYGWIMIGANNASGALKEASRSTIGVTIDKLEQWDGIAYIPATL